ncbi:MAG: CocE/NonD family hydrolase [Pseudomonadota bacterium]
MSDIQSGRNSVTFHSMGYKIAAHLYTPDDFDPAKSYPAVVFTSPGTSVKEMSGAVYGAEFSKRGYVFLVFDRIGFGESEGPLQQPIAIHFGTEALRDAISFLRSHSFVDRNKVFGLGLCVGSQQMVQVAVTDKRLKAIATGSGMLDSFVFMRNFMTPEQRHDYYLAANEARQAYFETGEMATFDYFPKGDASDQPEHSTARKGQEYYNGDVPPHPRYSSVIPANSAEYEWGNHAVSFGPYLETPYMGIVGEFADLAPLTKAFFDVCTDPKEYVIIPGKDHVDLYQDAASEVCDAATGFFEKHSA